MKFLTGTALAMLAMSPHAAYAAEPGAASPFIQCDGRTGHVSGGERFMRLLLVTATAGISEAAMAGDDDSRRAKGAAGVAACDAAIAKETDLFRRAQLGLAKSLHYAEDQKWAETEQAAHAVPGLIGRTGDWALERSVSTAAANIEAWALVQQGKLAEAEAVQASAVVRAGSDALALQRPPMYLRLTTSMSDIKRRAYWHLFRFAPQHEPLVINGFADARQYDDARVALANADAVQRAMYNKPPSAAETASLDAVFAAMAGKPAEGAASLAKARIAFAKERADGTNANLIASIEEQIRFAEAAIAHAEGRDADARRIVSQRGVWAHIAPGVAADLLSRLSASAPAQERIGPLAEPMAVWNDSVSSKVAAIKEDAVRKRHWRSLTELMVDDHYRPMAKQAMSGSSAKPKWLLKPDREEPLKFDLIAVDGRFFGQAVNEPMMLHAALIAKARGKTGFVLFPTRKGLSLIGVKFANPGDEGIGAAAIVEADLLIAELSPRINSPVAAGGN